METRWSIWTQHGENEDFGSTVVWFEIDPAASSLLQWGEILPPGGQFVDYIYNGAISSDRKVFGASASFGSGMAIGFNTSNATSYVTDEVVSQVGSDPLSTYTDVAPSASAFQQLCNTPRNPDDCPWGDYSGASPDPAGTRGAVWFTNAWVDSQGSWATQNWEAVVGNVAEYPVPTANSYPEGIAKAGRNLWFTELDGSKIGKVTPAGAFTEYLLPGGAGPLHITPGPDGNLWFTELFANKIGKMTPAGALTEYPVPTAASGPWNITAGPDGNLWFTENYANKVAKVTTGGAFTEFAVPTSGAAPAGITTGPDHNLWVTEAGAHKIAKVTTSGVFTEYLIPTPTGASAITAGPDGNLWFTESADKIGKVTTGGAFTEYPIPTPASDPIAITAGPDGNVWFNENGANQIGKVTASGVFFEYPIPTLGSEPDEGITAGPDGNIWFTEYGANHVGKVVIH